MTYYFNKKLYTDVQSWKVIELDETKGEATVIEVKKECLTIKYNNIYLPSSTNVNGEK